MAFVGFFLNVLYVALLVITAPSADRLLIDA